MQRALVVLLATLSSIVAVVVPTPPTASALAAWSDGTVDYSTVTSCASIIFGSSYVDGGWVVQPPPLQGYGVGAFASQAIDVETGSPTIGQKFYIRLYSAGITQPCTNQLVFPEFTLPSGVTPAYSSGDPIVCLVNNTPDPAACPTALGTGTYGQYWVPSRSQYNAWTGAAGNTVEIRIPVVANRAIAGEPLHAFFKVIDGHASPVLHTTVGLTVFPTTSGGGGSQLAPSVSHPAESTIDITESSATLTTWVQPGPTGGIAKAVLFADAALTVPLLTTQDEPLLPNQEGYTMDSHPSGLSPGTTYYWRGQLTPTGGATIYGATQSFRTLDAGAIDMLPGDCNEASLRAALATSPTEITFSCGDLPITIPLTSGLEITQPVVIDGGGLVTLNMTGAGSHSQVQLLHQNNGVVELRNLTLTRTAGEPSCGGLLLAQADTIGVLTNVTMRGGVASSGGALCVSADAELYVEDSSIVGNRATEGGAALNRGILTISGSEVTGNVATTGPGGGIYSALGTLDISRSSFVANVAAAPASGAGAIYGSSGSVYVYHSTISGNRAAVGGGIYLESSVTSPIISRVTFADNQTTTASSGVLDIRGGTVQYSIFGPTTGRSCPTGSRTITLISNLESSNTCGLAGSSGIANADLRLGPLAVNSGGTRSYSLRLGSAAIDTDIVANCASSDQRFVSNNGGVRGFDGNGDGSATCDTGSFELVPGDFQALQPRRYLETRTGQATFDGISQGIGQRPAGSTTEVQVGGRGGIPASTWAVALNVTAVGGTTPGYVTVYPCGSPVPGTSSLNALASRAVANNVVTKLGTDGKVCIFNQTAMNLIVDVTGLFPIDTDVEFLGTTRRMLDTRAGSSTFDGQFAGIGKRAAGSETVLQVGGRSLTLGAGTSVYVNITALKAAGQGFITVYPCGTPRPTASTLNFVAGEPVANGAWIALRSVEGLSTTLCLYTSQAVDLIVDLVAVSGSQVWSDLRTLQPARLLDTRPGQQTVDGQAAGAGVRPAGTVTELQVSGRGGVDTNVEAVTINVLGLNAYVTVYPCGDPRPTTSTLNVAASAPRANGAIVEVGVGGKICIFNSHAMHLIVDITGNIRHATQS